MTKLFHFFLIFSFIVPSAFAQNEPKPLEGAIVQISSLDKDQVEIFVQTQKGKNRFVIDRLTIIHGVSRVGNLKKGEKILVGNSGAGGGASKRNFPYGVSEPVRKLAGLPKVPGLPEVPKVPKAPKAPQVPKPPKVPGRNVTAKSGGTQGEAAPPAENEKKQKPRGQEFPENPNYEKDTTAKLIPQPLSRTSAPPMTPASRIKKIIEIEQSGKDFKIKLEDDKGNEEEVAASPDQEVVRLMELKELKKNMKVVIPEVSGEGRVRRLVVI